MNLGFDLRQYLAKQAHIAGTQMKSEAATSNLEVSLYYYSAVYGALQRAVNIQFDKQLLLVCWVFLHSHQAIASRLAAMRQSPGREAPVTIVPAVMSILADAVIELGRRIDAGEDNFLDILEQVAVASYSTGGNGFYLMDTGVLKL